MIAASNIALIVLPVILGYAGIGAAFAAAFAAWGAGRIDPVARHGTWGFRLLILPGAVALWPLLLVRWRRAEHTTRGPS
jgi:hypothetical protein